MPSMICMPKIGVNMTDAIITKWLVKEGDIVEPGQSILVAETDKATQEIPITEKGKVVKLISKESDRVDCQQPILVLECEGENLTESEIDQFVKSYDKTKVDSESVETVPDSFTAELAPKDGVSPGKGDTIKISPLAKKRAKELNIDYRLVTPLKPGARITTSDVERYVQSTKTSQKGSELTPKKDKVKEIPLTQTRRVIGERMTQSVLTKPSVALVLHVDASALLNWKSTFKKAGQDIGFNEMFVAIAAKALREFPMLNSTMTDDCIECHEDINIGIAVEYNDGLVVPKIFQADKKSLIEIRDDLSSKVEKIRTGNIDLEDISGGTFTITNLGMYEIEQFDAIINPPECAILAMGKIMKRPVVKDDEIVIGNEMALTLAFDHRIVDGALAARFLRRIKHLAEDPLLLV